jgi:ABC-type glycerol-3-phosphate transport system permease component
MTASAPAARARLRSASPTEPGTPRTDLRRPAERAFNHLILILVAFTLAMPFLYVVSASLKDSISIFEYPPRLFPLPLYLGNYEQLITQTGFLRWIANTLIVATSVTVIKVFIDSMAGYALAKLKFRGKRLVFASLLVLLMVPLGVLLVPMWAVVHALHINDTYLALILPPLANPLGVFLMRQFILGLPGELENAGRLDGVGEFGIYWRIILPLVKPGLVVLAVIVFTDQFMSFAWPLIATSSDELQVLTVGLAAFRAKGGVNYGIWSAAAVLSLIPMAIFFFMLQRQFMSRNLAGALKQ